MMKALILGAGCRGRAYAEYAQAHPDQLEIVGVAATTCYSKSQFRRRKKNAARLLIVPCG